LATNPMWLWILPGLNFPAGMNSQRSFPISTILWELVYFPCLSLSPKFGPVAK
jgi:hypothetical protein